MDRLTACQISLRIAQAQLKLCNADSILSARGGRAEVYPADVDELREIVKSLGEVLERAWRLIDVERDALMTSPP